MKVPLLDLRLQHEAIRDELLAAVTRVIDSTRYILGPENEQLEQSIAHYCGVPYALGVSSGTDALLLSLMALDIQSGDRVLVPDFSFFATAGVVSRLHAIPIFVDIDPVTYNISSEHCAVILQQMSEEERAQTKAIIPVHLYGQCASMEALVNLGKQYGLAVIEDAAQAIGAEFSFQGETKKAGSMGNLGCFSFFPSKNLGGIGDGGLITVQEEALYQKIQIKRVHGAESRYYHKVIGGNFRLDSIQACILNIKLQHLNSWHEQRQQNAAHYQTLFATAQIEEISTPVSVYAEHGLQQPHIYNQYVVRAQKRDELKSFLQSKEIACDIYYPIPFHQQECFQDRGYSVGEFPEAEAASQSVLALPIYPGMTPEMREYVVTTIKEFYQSRR